MGGHKIPEIFQKYPKKHFVRKLFTLLDIFKTKNKHFKIICSYIHKMTQNPINVVKIIIYNTKHTKHTKIHFQKLNYRMDWLNN